MIYFCFCFTIFTSETLIQIGPPNSQILKSKDKNTWSAKDVADSVLADKSALVIYLCITKLSYAYAISMMWDCDTVA